MIFLQGVSLSAAPDLADALNAKSAIKMMAKFLKEAAKRFIAYLSAKCIKLSNLQE